jgi:hypothetical protein
VARKLSFAPGDLLLLDRGYVDFAWLYSLHQRGVGFVTRLPRNVRYQVVQQNPIPADAAVLADQTIRLTTAHSRSRDPETLRLVHYRDPETGKDYVFLTNLPDLPRLVQNLIMARCNLWALLCPRTSDPPDYGQLTLFNLGGAR